MKGNGGIITNLLVLVAGIVLIVLHDREGILPGIIIITGVTFIVPSVLNGVMLLMRRRRDENRMARLSATVGMIASLGGLALGVWMVLFPDSLVGLLVYLFAALLLLGGLYHLYVLLFGFRPLKFPLWMYVIPTVLVAAGIMLLCSDINTIETYIVLVAGIAMVLFSAGSFLEHIGARSFNASRNRNLPEETL